MPDMPERSFTPVIVPRDSKGVAGHLKEDAYAWNVVEPDLDGMLQQIKANSFGTIVLVLVILLAMLPFLLVG